MRFDGLFKSDFVQFGRLRVARGKLEKPGVRLWSSAPTAVRSDPGQALPGPLPGPFHFPLCAAEQGLGTTPGQTCSSAGGKLPEELGVHALGNLGHCHLGSWTQRAFCPSIPSCFWSPSDCCVRHGHWINEGAIGNTFCTPAGWSRIKTLSVFRAPAWEGFAAG